MLLTLDGIKVSCIIGDLPHERLAPQSLRVDVELQIPDTAAKSDDLADTVDYVAVKDRVAAVLAANKPRLIERAALMVYEALEGYGARKVKVTKFGAIPDLDSASAIYP